MPTVRNIKYANRRDHNIYIGRTIYGNYGEVYRKGSPLANPFKEIRKGTEQERHAERERVIADYGIWLRDKVKAGDPKVWEALRSINETSVLLCYCYPKNCHGHKIVAMWTWAKNKGLIDHVTTPHSSDKTLKTVAHANLVKTTTTVQRHGENGAQRTTTTTPALAPPLHKDLGPEPAPGPLDLMAVMDKLAASLGTEIPDPNALHEEGKIIQHVCTPDTAHLIDARLDETILEKCTCDKHDYCQEPETAEGAYAELERLSKVHVPYVPRKTRRPRLSFDEPRSLVFNRLDTMLLDLADLAPVIAKHEAQDRAFDRAEMRYEREQLAILCHESLSEVA